MVVRAFEVQSGNFNQPVYGIQYSNPVDYFAFYVPGATAGNSMTWTQGHEYTDVKLMRLATSMLGAGGEFLAGLMTLMGKPLNPYVDVLFRNTNLREYQFNILMAPQTPTEATQMKNIVKRLRWHAAPNLDSATQISPNQFDIRFYYRNENGGLIENTNIPKIGTGVIKRIDIDYNPGGEWSTFYDGTPVSAMLTFTFMETGLVGKTQIDQGF